MEKLKNKLITPKVVIEIAEMLSNRLSKLKSESEICEKENEGKPYDEQYFSTALSHNELQFSIMYENDTKEQRESLEWFKDILTNKAKFISGIIIRYDVNYNYNVKHKWNENNKSEYFRLYLDMANNYCYGELDIRHSDNNEEFFEISRKINNIISNCPDRYDNTFKKKSLYRTMPSFAMSMILSLIVSATLFALVKMNVLPESFSAYLLQYPIILIGGGLLLALLLGFVLPNSNMGHYKKLIVDKKYDHYDTNWKIEHYENDFERYQSQVEFAVGKYYQSNITREKIAKNYKHSVIAFTLSLVAFAVLAVLMFTI